VASAAWRALVKVAASTREVAWMVGLTSRPSAPCSPCLSRDIRCRWKQWWWGAVVMGLGGVRTRGGVGAQPTAYEPPGPSLDPYKRKSHKYKLSSNLLSTVQLLYGREKKR
jgi:hypothetical protein